MTQHQHADAKHKSLLITAVRKTVIIPSHLLARQNGARGINNHRKKATKAVPKPADTQSFYAKCGSSHFFPCQKQQA